MFNRSAVAYELGFSPGTVLRRFREAIGMSSAEDRHTLRARCPTRDNDQRATHGPRADDHASVAARC